MNSKPEKEEQHRRADFASKKGEVVLRPHEYDGIQEFDQKLPNWWLVSFYTAVIFYLIYWFVYYQAGFFETDQAKVTNAISEVQKKQQEELQSTLSSLTDEILVNEWAADNSIVGKGEEIYNQICFACHGPELDAPNKLGLSLVDGEWKYGGRPLEIFKLINDGTPPESKGMAPTGARMMPKGGGDYTAEQIAQVTAFLISKNPKDFEDYVKK